MNNKIICEPYMKSNNKILDDKIKFCKKFKNDAEKRKEDIMLNIIKYKKKIQCMNSIYNNKIKLFDKDNYTKIIKKKIKNNDKIKKIFDFSLSIGLKKPLDIFFISGVNIEREKIQKHIDSEIIGSDIDITLLCINSLYFSKKYDIYVLNPKELTIYYFTDKWIEHKFDNINKYEKYENIMIEFICNNYDYLSKLKCGLKTIAENELVIIFHVLFDLSDK